MHQEAREWVISSTRGHWPRVLEIGSRNVNGSVRDLIDSEFYWGIDLAPGPGVDEVADGGTWRFHDAPFDLVVCCEVFEHSPSWTAIVIATAENLRAGGTAVFTMATDPRPAHSAIDEDPIRPEEFYKNV